MYVYAGDSYSFSDYATLYQSTDLKNIKNIGTRQPEHLRLCVLKLDRATNMSMGLLSATVAENIRYGNGYRVFGFGAVGYHDPLPHRELMAMEFNDVADWQCMGQYMQYLREDKLDMTNIFCMGNKDLKHRLTLADNGAPVFGNDNLLYGMALSSLIPVNQLEQPTLVVPVASLKSDILQFLNMEEE